MKDAGSLQRHASLEIGDTTSFVATGSVMLGKRVGAHLGIDAAVIGGIVLVVIGSPIMYQRLSA